MRFGLAPSSLRRFLLSASYFVVAVEKRPLRLDFGRADMGGNAVQKPAMV